MRLLVFFFSCAGLWAADGHSPLEFGTLKFGVIFRTRYESRTGVSLGRDPDVSSPLFRTLISAQWKPVGWLKVTGMLQDSRAPFYGRPAPSSVRESSDLHEGFLELFPDRKAGFGAILGRQRASYGDGRLIGSPEWGNIGRTYDTVRLYYRAPAARIEFLVVSPIKVQGDRFNTPVLGDRIWGTYNSFSKFIPNGVVDLYVLRRDQNRQGGFGDPGRLGITTFGGRLTAPLGAGLKLGIETAAQTGHAGPRKLRAGAWFSSLSRRVQLGIPFDLSAEYKYASGTADPDGPRSGTYDQLYPAAHDKLGHVDLFGWRNLHNIRSLTTARVTRELAVNFMYNNSWLASRRDFIYNLQGRPLVRAPRGDAGSHVGQEFDLFANFTRGWLQLGGGFGYLHKGRFLRTLTPTAKPGYLYLLQQFTW